MFSISFLSEIKAGAKSSKGSIIIGSSTEYFLSSFDYWTPNNYRKQWLKAVALIQTEESRSALITDVPFLSPPSFINWWPMWRFGQLVKIQEQLLILEDLTAPFDINNPYIHLGEYESINEEGQPISEWTVSVSDLIQFSGSI